MLVRGDPTQAGGLVCPGTHASLFEGTRCALVIGLVYNIIFLVR